MSDKLRTDLSNYRIEKAREMVRDAEVLLTNGSYASSNNRAYYAIFNAMRAVLALDGVEFKRHSGNIQYFLKNYVKTCIFPTNISDMILETSKARNDSDYDDFYEPDEEESEQLVEHAKEVIRMIQEYLEGVDDAADIRQAFAGADDSDDNENK